MLSPCGFWVKERVHFPAECSPPTPPFTCVPGHVHRESMVATSAQGKFSIRQDLSPTFILWNKSLRLCGVQ